MSTPKKPKSPRFGSRQPLAEQLRSDIIQFLEHKLGQLQVAEERTKTMYKVSRLEGIKSNWIYYQHAVAVTKWLIAQAKSKKRQSNLNAEESSDDATGDAASRI